MTINKYELSRAGMLNYWYYDDREFDFRGGKLLLRGSNGSGKSVTMQSLLPLLLDGNKEPSRLDPFGSRSRKMIDYLLGENGERRDRIGYLYLEYKRRNTEEYVTTGLGLKVTSSSDKVESWGFVIKNRRMGHDFFLYNEGFNEKGEPILIPLTRQDLIARVEEEGCGQVVLTNAEYAELVNQSIFKFKTMKGFYDLVKLIVTIRTPKLSNDLKPERIYEILEDSQAEIALDDLTALAETIQNIDKHKERLETTKQELAHATAIAKAYDDYNEAMLAKKAEELLEARGKWQEAERSINKTLNELKRAEARHAELILHVQELHKEEQQLKEKLERMRDSDAFKTKRDLQQKARELDESERTVVSRKDAKSTKDAREREARTKLRDLTDEVARIKKDTMSRLDELASVAEEIDFTEHEQLQMQASTLLENETVLMAVDQWRDRLKNHTDVSRTILQVLQQEVDQQVQVDGAKDALEKVKVTKKTEEEAKRQNEEALEESIETLDACIHAWSHQNEEYVLNGDETERIMNATGLLFEGTLPTDVSQIIQDGYEQRKQELTIQQLEAKNGLKRIQEEINRKEQEKKAITDKRDPEPETRRPETVHVREKLQMAGVPFVPFYEAVDFVEGVDGEERERIEASLAEMGVLDSLIVSTSYTHVITENDTVLQPSAPLTNVETLRKYLRPVSVEGVDIAASEIEAVLAGIAVIPQMQEPYVTTTGAYRHGIVTGAAVPTSASRFIGKESRRLYRLFLLEQLTKELEELEEQKHQLLGQSEQLSRRVSTLTQENRSFPSMNDIVELHDKDKRLHDRIQFLQEQENEQLALLQQQIERLRALQVKREELSRGRKIALRVSAYQNLMEAIDHYSVTLNQLRDLCKDLINRRTTAEQQFMAVEQAEADAQEAHEEVLRAKKQRDLLAAQVKGMKEALIALDGDQIDDQIALVDDRLTKIPKENVALVEERTRAEGETGQLKENVSRFKRHQDFYASLYDARERLFEMEMQIVGQPFDYNQLIGAAQDIIYTDSSNNRAHVMGKRDKLSDAYHAMTRGLMNYSPLWSERTAEVQMPNAVGESLQFEIDKLEASTTRVYLSLNLEGRAVTPQELKLYVEKEVMAIEEMITEQNENVFKEIIYNNVGERIRELMLQTSLWKDEINQLMAERVVSSGLKLRLEWNPRKSKNPDELPSRELVSLLQKDPETLRETDYRKLTNHFNAKIAEVKAIMDSSEAHKDKSMEDVMQEVLDYRKWFEFKLFIKKGEDKEKELTKDAYLALSGGERALAMYIPLFAAIFSRYSEASPEAPYIISMDEAFAGVDSENIADMFGLIEKLDFNFIINSQVLWGDYETISALGISEIIRPNNAKHVTVLNYEWDGRRKTELPPRQVAPLSKAESLVMSQLEQLELWEDPNEST
ncbi:TIGR02680 family protein [Paenibacillus sp. J5C_2022]|uniref:TIGR02680 family protein n=1 Tax=Paenibacillus sp. J5C2022 TaxID=2977129 RepID=UPI0021D33E70|nr:TIGR02680 family protein [Paenibacillus sp. J5C2022]MCU6709731.1 TIGR02680 family protein [Paenibacillus sp. J5C2022]